MLWLLVAASLVGFLAVGALTQVVGQSTALPTLPTPWLWLSGSCLGGLVVLLLLNFWHKHRTQRHRLLSQSQAVSAPQTSSWLSLFGQGAVYTLAGALMLLASASFGVAQTLMYQARLLNAPLTVTADVSVPQISDTLSDFAVLSAQDQANDATGFVIGNGYPRQVWQIKRLQHLAADEVGIVLPMRVLVTADTTKHPDWQATLNALAPNQSLRVKLTLQPIRARDWQDLPTNATPLNLGFDEALWLRQRDVTAKAQLLAILPTQVQDSKTDMTWRGDIERLRWQLRQNLYQHLTAKLSHQTTAAQQVKTLNSYAILLGLLTGDKSLLTADIKNLYQVTGISHLLAISGPHVLLLASVVSTWVLVLVRLCVPNVLRRVPAQLLVLWVSVVVASGYALLVGFELPAQRTLLMLIGVTLATQWLVAAQALRILAMVGLMMLWLDTTAVWQAGFWLSFVAVGLLLQFSKHTGEQAYTRMADSALSGSAVLAHIGRALWELLRLQIWLFVLMMPVVVWFFGKIAVLDIAVNLFAVPLLGGVIVPLDMLAGVLSLLPFGQSLSGAVWALAAWLLGGFHAVLHGLLAHGFAKQVFIALTPSQLLLCALMVGLWLARGLLPRLLVVPLFALVLVIGMTRREQTAVVPVLAVLPNAKISVSLVVAGDDAWLILADNQNLTSQKPSTATKPNTPIRSVVPTIAKASDLLATDIYPLLATYRVSRLSGVISQTPSALANAAVQQLAQTVPIHQYWLAGADALTPLTDAEGEKFAYPNITPKPCQAGQTWHNQPDTQHIRATLSLTAITGWQLKLPPDMVLSPRDRAANQTCLITLGSQTAANQPYRVLLAAGRDGLPFAMSQVLCRITVADLLITPYQLPLSTAWLADIQPKQVHVLSGQYDNQQLGESSETALLTVKAMNTAAADDASHDATLADPAALTDSGIHLIRAHRVGAVSYELKPNDTLAVTRIQ